MQKPKHVSLPCLLKSKRRDTKKELLIVSLIEDFKQPSLFEYVKLRIKAC